MCVAAVSLTKNAEEDELRLAADEPDASRFTTSSSSAWVSLAFAVLAGLTSRSGLSAIGLCLVGCAFVMGIASLRISGLYLRKGFRLRGLGIGRPAMKCSANPC